MSAFPKNYDPRTYVDKHQVIIDDLDLIKGGDEWDADANLGEAWKERIHTTRVFPEVTNETCTLESPDGTANSFSAWTEVVDNNVVTFSSKFASADGHIFDVYVVNPTLQDKEYLLEIGVNIPQTVVFRKWFKSGTGLFLSDQGSSGASAEIGLGDTIYYRLMCDTVGGDTTIKIFYFLY